MKPCHTAIPGALPRPTPSDRPYVEPDRPLHGDGQSRDRFHRPRASWTLFAPRWWDGDCLRGLRPNLHPPARAGDLPWELLRRPGHGGFLRGVGLARHLGAGRLLATDRRVARPAGEQARLRSQMTHHRLAATERAFQRLSPGECRATGTLNFAGYPLPSGAAPDSLPRQAKGLQGGQEIPLEVGTPPHTVLVPARKAPGTG